MIVQTIPFYEFEDVNWNISGGKGERFDPHFLLRFSAVPEQLSGQLLSHPCGFQLAVWDKAAGSTGTSRTTFLSATRTAPAASSNAR